MPFTPEQLHQLLINANPDQKGTVAECCLRATFQSETQCRIAYEMCGDGIERTVARVRINVDIAERAADVADFLLAAGDKDDGAFVPDIDLVRVTIVDVVVKSRKA